MHPTLDIQVFQINTLLARVWALKVPLVISSMLVAISAAFGSLYLGSNFTYEALLRIEPEVSTTGEQTSLEAETDVLKSWALVAATIEDMQRNVWVRQVDSQKKSPLALLRETIHARMSHTPLPEDIMRAPSPKVEQFYFSSDIDVVTLGEFNLEVLAGGRFKLADAMGNRICTVAAQERCVGYVNAPKKPVTLTAMFDMGTAKPGQHFIITPVRADTMIRTLREQVNVTRLGFRERSGLLQVEFNYPDPVFAKQFLERYIDHYLRQAYDRSSLGKIKALRNLEDAAVELREKLAEAEKEMETFQREARIVDLPSRSRMLAESVERAERDIDAVTVEMNTLSASYLPAHPAMQALASQLATHKQKLLKLQREIADLPHKERRALELQRAIDTRNKILDANTRNIAQLSAEVEMITGYARLISPPNVRGRALFRRAPVYGFIGALIGAAPWLMLVAFQSLPMFSRIRGVGELPLYTSIPVIATLGRDPRLSRRMRWRRRGWVDPSAYDASADTRRVIEALTQQSRFMLSTRANNKVVAMTALESSGDIAELACLFAESMARSRRTLLVDANIMQPSIAAIYQRDHAPGLSDVISGQVNLDKVIYPAGIDNLFVIGAGTQTPNYRLLHEVERWKTLISLLTKGFDCIVIAYPALDSRLWKQDLFDNANMVLVRIARASRLLHLRGLKHAGLEQHAGASILYTTSSA